MSSIGRLESLTKYLPAALLRLVSADPELATPSARRVPAVALLADISGFTALADRLAEQGPAGAEALSQALNAHFGELNGLIHRSGGEVVRYAGDAALAFWFPAVPGDLSDTVHRAAQCGLAITRAVKDREASDGTGLQVHVGIGAGEAFMASLGGLQERCEFLVGGSSVQQLDAAMAHADVGDVVLTEHAWSLVAARAHGEPVGSRCVRLSAVIPGDTPVAPRIAEPMASAGADAERLARRYVSRTVVARIDAGHENWLAEFRRVTVLFSSLGRVDYDDSKILETLQAAMLAWQAGVYHQDGTINQVIADDKGTTALAIWGLVTRSHEDDATRALRAAQAIQASFRTLGLTAACGVATGRVFSGKRGDLERCEYAVIGNVVNLAARLMQAARDEIICDESTREAAARHLTFQALPPLMVKGKPDPIPVYRPTGNAAIAPSRLPPIAGRQLEVAALVDRLRRLQNQAGGVLVIEGEAGIGKTRLVAELLTEAETRGLTRLVAPAEAVEQSSPYLAWRAPLREVLRLEERGDKGAQRQFVLDSLKHKPELLRWVPLLDAILPLDFADDAHIRTLSGQVRGELTRELAVSLLQAVLAGKPAVLVLEDAHWLDPSSWALALAVHRRAMPLLIVVATRPLGTATVAECRELLQDTDTRLSLEPLASADALALVRHSLGVASLPDAVATLITEKAEGHPFFAEELAFALRDSGVIAIRDGECRLVNPRATLDGVQFPDTVEAVILSRIDRLPPQLQLTLKAASVIGRTFSLRGLTATHPMTTPDLEVAAQLHTLDELGITPLDGPEPNQTYIFKHAITQRVTYELLTFSQRHQLHRAVAEWYERDQASALESYYPLLAHHWMNADVPPRAVEFLEKAGDQAVLTGAHREASTFFNHALTINDEHPRALAEVVDALRVARWKRQLSVARQGLGDHVGCRDQLLSALELLGQPAPRSRAAWLRLIARHVTKRLAYEVFSRRRRTRPVHRREWLVEAARAADNLLQPYHYAGDVVPFIGATLLAVNLGDRSDAAQYVGNSQAALGFTIGTLNLHALADRWFDRALESAKNADHPREAIRVLVLRAYYLEGAGRWADAERAADEALERAHAHGDPQLAEDAHTMAGLAALCMGRLSDSVAAFDRLYRSARVRSNAHHEAWGLYGMARAMIPQGRLDEAIELIEKALSLLPGTGDHYSVMLCHGLLAGAELQQGRPERARAAADRMVELTRGSFPRAFPLLHAYMGTADAYLGLLEQTPRNGSPFASDVADAARGVCRELRRFARVFRCARPAADLYAARWHWLDKHPVRARRAWQRSLATATTFGMPYELALAHFDRGRLDRGAKESVSDLDAALALFTRLGCSARIDNLTQIIDSHR